MKWMIASDIHGSAWYCRAMFERMKKENAQRLLLLGDLLYHGPRNDLPKEYDPKKVIALLNAHKHEIVCVQGNCDADVDQMVLAFPIMNASVIFDCGDFILYACHGHHPLPSLQKGDILLQGHTHVPMCKKTDTYLHLNPGSISLPKENSRHSYMIWEHKTMIWKDMDGIEYMRYEWRGSDVGYAD